jgi:predicted RNA binding protein YcfA (HicA-like mRNA interferase family)
LHGGSSPPLIATKTNPMKLQDFKKEYDALSEKKNLKGKEAMKAVKKNGYALRYVHEQTEAICLEAVKQHGYALQYVHEQTEAICLEAVKQNGPALKYAHEQTEAICLEAVKQNGYALQYVHEQTETICLEAVKQNSYALQYINARFFENMPEEIIELNGVKYKRID